MLAFVQLDNQLALHSYGTTGKQDLPIIQGRVAHVQVRRVSPTWNHSSDRMVLHDDPVCRTLLTTSEELTVRKHLYVRAGRPVMPLGYYK